MLLNPSNQANAVRNFEHICLFCGGDNSFATAPSPFLSYKSEIVCFPKDRVYLAKRRKAAHEVRICVLSNERSRSRCC